MFFMRSNNKKITMNIEYLSASRLNVYVDCPFRYFLQYHLKLPELREATIHTHKGSAVHEALEVFAKGEADYLRVLREYYAEHSVWEFDNRPQHKGFPHPQPKTCETCPWAVVSEGMTVCAIANKNIHSFDGCPRPNFEEDLSLTEKAINRDDSPLSRKIIGAEVSFDNTYEGFRVHGYIDLITEVDNDTLEVSDYKTGNYMKNTDEAWKDLQMRIYSLVAKEKYPQYKNVLMTLDYLKSRPITVIFSKEDDDKTRSFLAEVYQKIQEDEDPIRKKSFKCNWCVGYEECGKIREQYISKGRFILPIAKEAEVNG